MNLLEAVETVARLAGARALSQFRSQLAVETKRVTGQDLRFYDL